jgi:hypothetical protein
VIADMVWRPRFGDDDLVNERQIVLEEIAMYEDDPQDKVFDVLGEAGLRRASARPGDHRPRRGRRRHAADGLRAFHASATSRQHRRLGGRLARSTTSRRARRAAPRPSASARRCPPAGRAARRHAAQVRF